MVYMSIARRGLLALTATCSMMAATATAADALADLNLDLTELPAEPVVLHETKMGSMGEEPDGRAVLTMSTELKDGGAILIDRFTYGEDRAMRTEYHCAADAGLAMHSLRMEAINRGREVTVDGTMEDGTLTLSIGARSESLEIPTGFYTEPMLFRLILLLPRTPGGQWTFQGYAEGYNEGFSGFRTAEDGTPFTITCDGPVTIRPLGHETACTRYTIERGRGVPTRAFIDADNTLVAISRVNDRDWMVRAPGAPE